MTTSNFNARAREKNAPPPAKKRPLVIHSRPVAPAVVTHQAPKPADVAPRPLMKRHPLLSSMNVFVSDVLTAQAAGPLRFLVLGGQDVVVSVQQTGMAAPFGVRSDRELWMSQGLFDALTAEDAQFLLKLPRHEGATALPVRVSSRPRSLAYWARLCTEDPAPEVFKRWGDAIGRVESAIAALEPLAGDVADDDPFFPYAPDHTMESLLASKRRDNIGVWTAAARPIVAAAREAFTEAAPTVKAPPTLESKIFTVPAAWAVAPSNQQAFGMELKRALADVNRFLP